MNEDPYRRVAGIYDRIFETMTRSVRLRGVRMFPAEQGMKVLDVGCGTGLHLDLYRKSGCKLFGIDTSPSMLNVARHRLGEHADLRIGDASEMPYESNTFDLILCMFVLHEMEQSTRLSVIAEMKRVLKNEGRILLIDFHTGPFRPLQGWVARTIILISEVSAGGRHFRNFRHFMSISGLPGLLEESQLTEEQRRVTAGGALAIHIVRPK